MNTKSPDRSTFILFPDQPFHQLSWFCCHRSVCSNCTFYARCELIQLHAYFSRRQFGTVAVISC
jgi:hypothetical protein